MSTLATQLLDLVHAVSTAPWPATTQEWTQWATRVGLLSHGKPIDGDGDGVNTSFTAPSHTGRAFWDLTPAGGLAHVSLIVATLDPAEFDSLRADAETLRTILDQSWEPVDGDVKGADWRAEWHSGDTDVEVYWSDPSRDAPPVDAALHLAFSPVSASDTPPHGQGQFGRADLPVPSTWGCFDNGNKVDNLTVSLGPSTVTERAPLGPGRRCEDRVMADVQVTEVDERSSSWEDESPLFRVYFFDSGENATEGSTATYDVAGCDILQVVSWAQSCVTGQQTYSVALVVHDAEQEALAPGHGAGLVWLVGCDGNDGADTARRADLKKRMLQRRDHPVGIPRADRFPDANGSLPHAQ